MRVDTRFEDGIVIMTLKGKLMGGPQMVMLKEEVDKYLSEGYRKFVWSLSGVTWINSSALGWLFGALTAAKKLNGQLVLAGLQEKAAALFSITKLNTLIDEFETVDEAVGFLKKSSNMNDL